LAAPSAGLLEHFRKCSKYPARLLAVRRDANVSLDGTNLGSEVSLPFFPLTLMKARAGATLSSPDRDALQPVFGVDLLKIDATQQRQLDRPSASPYHFFRLLDREGKCLLGGSK